MQQVEIASAQSAPAQGRPVPLPLRNDTMLGVCAALGEDLGFNPNYLRVLLGSIVIFNVLWAIGAYLALGVVVGASRLLFPARRAAAVAGQSAIAEANDDAVAPDALAA